MSKQIQTHFYVTVLFGPIGDALMTAALFDDILQLDPQARFLVLARNNVSLIRDVLQAYPSVEVREIPNGLRALPLFASLMTHRCVFLALGVAGAYSLRLKLFFALLSLRAGNRSIGFNDRESGQKSRLPLHHVLLFDPTRSTIDNLRRLLPPLFGDTEASNMSRRPPRAVLNLVRPTEWSLEPGCYIVVHFFGSRVIRRLPPRRMQELIAEIKQSYPAYALVLTGSEADRKAAEDVAAAVPGPTLFIGHSLLEVGWVIEHAALYIGVDTGITHVAGVLQQKSIIISHSADPMWMPLYNKNARVLLNSTRCTCNTQEPCLVEIDGAEYRRCMYDVSDRMILDSVALALSSTKRSVSGFAGLIDEGVGR